MGLFFPFQFTARRKLSVPPAFILCFILSFLKQMEHQPNSKPVDRSSSFAVGHGQRTSDKDKRKKKRPDQIQHQKRSYRERKQHAASTRSTKGEKERNRPPSQLTIQEKTPSSTQQRTDGANGRCSIMAATGDRFRICGAI